MAGIQGGAAPDQIGDAARRYAEQIQRQAQRDQRAKTNKPTRVRLILRRILGR